MLKTRYIKRATVVYPEILNYVLGTENLIPEGDIRYMYREILLHGRARAYKRGGGGLVGLTVGDRWCTGDERENTGGGRERGFSYRQGLEV